MALVQWILVLSSGFKVDQVMHHVKGVSIWLNTYGLPIMCLDGEKAVLVESDDCSFTVLLKLHFHLLISNKTKLNRTHFLNYLSVKRGQQRVFLLCFNISLIGLLIFLCNRQIKNFDLLWPCSSICPRRPTGKQVDFTSWGSVLSTNKKNLILHCRVRPLINQTITDQTPTLVCTDRCPIVES